MISKEVNLDNQGTTKHLPENSALEDRMKLREPIERQSSSGHSTI